MYNGYTEARKKANLKYMQNNTDLIQMRLPKGTKDSWKNAAKLVNMSMTAFVKMAVENQINFLKKE